MSEEHPYRTPPAFEQEHNREKMRTTFNVIFGLSLFFLGLSQLMNIFDESRHKADIAALTADVRSLQAKAPSPWITLSGDVQGPAPLGDCVLVASGDAKSAAPGSPNTITKRNLRASECTDLAGRLDVGSSWYKGGFPTLAVPVGAKP